jgi:hypothetical protein
MSIKIELMNLQNIGNLRDRFLLQWMVGDLAPPRLRACEAGDSDYSVQVFSEHYGTTLPIEV